MINILHTSKYSGLQCKILLRNYTRWLKLYQEKPKFCVSIKRKGLAQFSLHVETLREAASPLVGDPQLATFVCLQVAEQIVNGKFVSSEEVGISREAEDLSGAERDIIAYIAGFLFFSCTKYFKTVHSILDMVEKQTDTDGSSKLILVKSRGGLSQPSTSFVDFIMLLEFVFRSLCNSSAIVPMRQDFVISVCQDAGVGVFYTATYHTNSDTALQEKFILY
jgi:hypothetical protein